jgi:hypothetical protein
MFLRHDEWDTLATEIARFSFVVTGHYARRSRPEQMLQANTELDGVAQLLNEVDFTAPQFEDAMKLRNWNSYFCPSALDYVLPMYMVTSLKGKNLPQADLFSTVVDYLTSICPPGRVPIEYSHLIRALSRETTIITLQYLVLVEALARAQDLETIARDANTIRWRALYANVGCRFDD